MIEIIFGVAVGAGGMYFAMRFKEGLLAWKNRAEKEIDKKLKGDK